MNLRSAVADVESWMDQGKPPDSMDIVILPPKTVDTVSDEEDLDDDLTTCGAEQLPDDTPGEVEVQIREEEEEEEPIETPAPPTAKRQKKIQPKWKKNENFDEALQGTPPEALYRSHPELTLMSPFELFCMFFDDEVETLIIEQSNLYAKSKNNHSFKMSSSGLRRFMGIIYLSGYRQLPKQSLYWSKDEDVDTPIVRIAMSRNEFRTLKQYLHFADNRDLDAQDKMAKVRPLLDVLNKKLLQFGVFTESIVVDEQMVPYYGGHPSKMCLRMKPIRFGFKKWLLTSDCGYPFQLDVYQGKKSKAGVAADKTPLGTRVVKQFVDVTQDPTKHELFTDNLFTSYDLMVDLKELGMRATGTVRANRVNGCPLMSDKLMKKKDRGFMDYRSDGKVISKKFKRSHLREVSFFTGRGGPCIRDWRSAIFSGPPLAHTKKFGPPFGRREKNWPPLWPGGKNFGPPPLGLKM